MSQNLKIFLNSKFIHSSLIYSIVIGSMTGIRVCFIFLLGLFFKFDDVLKFSLYGALTISSDVLSIFGSYLSQKFLGKRISCILGFLLILCANTFLLISFLYTNKNLLFLSLCYISISIGILKCNLFMISNAHLDYEFEKNKNDYGSLLHNLSVLCSFLMLFVSGFLIKIHPKSIIIIAILTLFLSFIFFLISERKYILITFKNRIKNGIKFMHIIFMLLALNIILFIFFYNSSGLIISKIPIIIYICFVLYLLKRFFDIKSERRYIVASIIFSFFIILYLGFERQRDTAMALFLSRNIDLSILNNYIKFSAVQLNSFFSLFILSLGFILFKFKVHTKLKTKYSLVLINFFIVISFSILYLQTKFNLYFATNQEIFLLKPYPYILSMIFMACSNILVYSKFIEICRIMPKALSPIISSFMIVSVATGFFLAKIFNQFMIVENENNRDLIFGSIHSLKIYSDGFLKLSIISFMFLIFWLFFLSIKKIDKLFSFE
jgi:dipeptide/tripeptide permease